MAVQNTRFAAPMPLCFDWLERVKRRCPCQTIKRCRIRSQNSQLMQWVRTAPGRWLFTIGPVPRGQNANEPSYPEDRGDRQGGQSGMFREGRKPRIATPLSRILPQPDDALVTFGMGVNRPLGSGRKALPQGWSGAYLCRGIQRDSVQIACWSRMNVVSIDAPQRLAGQPASIETAGFTADATP